MGTWSVSQGKFIDTPQTTGAPSVGATDVQDQSSLVRSMLQMKALQDPKNASKYSSILGMFPETPAADIKTAKQGENAERVIRQLEDQYLFNKREALAYGRVDGAYQTYIANIASGKNPELRTYLASRDRNKPFLARAAGDVGNLSAPEQERAVAQLPTALSTPEEAIQGFEAVRQSLGLKPRDLVGEATTKQPDFIAKLPDEVKVKNIPNKIKDSEGTPIDERQFWQRVFNTGKKKVDVPLPDLPYGAVGMGTSAIPKSPLLGGAMAGVGNWLDQIRQKGIPLTKEGAKEYSATSSIPATAMGTGLNLLLNPIRTLGSARNALATGKTGQLGSSIIKGGEEFVKTGAGPQQVGTARKLLSEDVAKYGTSNKSVSLKQILEEATKRGQSAYNKTQTLKGSNAAAYNAATRDALKGVIKGASPTVSTLTDMLGKIYKGKSAVKSIISKALPFYLFSKVLK